MNHGRRLLTVLSGGLLLAGLAGCCFPNYHPRGSGSPFRPFVRLTNCYLSAENDLRRSGAQVVRVGDTVRIVIPVDRVFKVNSTELTACALPTLYYLSRLLRSCRCSNIDITVHTDNVFNPKRRLRLSAEQANVVAAHLWADGIDRRRIHFHGCSDFDQVSSDHTVFGSADNRRIEINVRG